MQPADFGLVLLFSGLWETVLSSKIIAMETESALPGAVCECGVG